MILSIFKIFKMDQESTPCMTEQLETAGGIILPDLKLHYKVIITKTVWH